MCDEMRTLSGTILAAAVGAVAFASDLSLERTASVYHSYEFVDAKDTPAPEGYTPFYVSHYGRHGSRRLAGTFVADTLAVLEKSGKEGTLTGQGKALLADIQKIAEAHEGMLGELSLRGAEEHRMLARRMAARFPDVFNGARNVRCRSSVYPRVLVSMANFTIALKDCAPGLSFTFETGEKILRVLNPPYMELKGRSPDLPEFPAPESLIKRLFVEPSSASNPSKFVHDLFLCASDCQCLREELGGLDIYRFFSLEEIASLFRALEAEMYGDMANSEEFGDAPVKISAKLWADFVARADEAIADDRIAADLRFGHDSGLWPLVGLLGLEGPGDRVPFADSWRDCPGWKWMSMASNLQIVFYRAKEGAVLVKILYNEREMRVRGIDPVTGPYYRWRDLKTQLADFPVPPNKKDTTKGAVSPLPDGRRGLLKGDDDGWN